MGILGLRISHIWGFRHLTASRTFAPCKIGKSVEKRSDTDPVILYDVVGLPGSGTTAGIPGGFARRIRRRVAYMRIRRADTVGKLRRPGYLPVRACRGRTL